MRAMPSMGLSTSLFLLIISVIRPVVAQNSTSFCDYFHVPQYGCDVCGNNYLIFSNPNRCSPNNATFDNIPTGPIGRYVRTNWTNFEAVAGNTTEFAFLPRIKPYSVPNYARLPAGKTGALSFSMYGATLYSLHYACALPLSGTPVGCNATFTGACGTEFVLDDSDTQAVTTSLSYDPSSPFNTTMAYSQGTIGYQRSHGACLNFSVTAVSHVGTPVDLYLDDVLLGVNVLCPNYPSGSCYPPP